MFLHWLFLATLCFLASFGYALFALGAGRFHSGRFNLLTVSLGFLALTAFLYQQGQLVKACPITNLFEVLIFLSWSIVLLYLAVGPVSRLSLMGAFTSALVLIILLCALLLPRTPSSAVVARLGVLNPWVEFHAALSMIAYGAFGLACVAGTMYLVQERQLKSRKPSELFYNLPPITDLSKINERLIFAGFSLFTVALVAGFLAHLPIAGMKFWTSLGIWALYGSFLFLHRVAILAPHRFAILSIATFTLALVTLPAIEALSPRSAL